MTENDDKFGELVGRIDIYRKWAGPLEGTYLTAVLRDEDGNVLFYQPAGSRTLAVSCVLDWMKQQR